jgi:hypothetical protein
LRNLFHSRLFSIPCFKRKKKTKTKELINKNKNKNKRKKTTLEKNVKLLRVLRRLLGMMTPSILHATLAKQNSQPRSDATIVETVAK